MIPVYKPYLPKGSLTKAHQALDSTWISSKGEYISEIENKLSTMYSLGDARINSATVTNNGTSATHLVAKLLNRKYPKINTIIVPNNVYVAAWNSFLFDNKYKLIAVEADLNTWNYNKETLYELLSKLNLETTALLVVHNVGNIVNVPQILRDWKDLVIVEDNCEGFLGQYEGFPSGSSSLASSISFFGNKNITSGEGGAVISSFNNLSFLYCLRSQGQSQKKFIHSELGYNYRMTNVQAAILSGQLDVVNDVVNMKKAVFDTYKKYIKEIDGVEFQVMEKNTTHSNWMFGVRIKGNDDYDNVEEFFHKNYIEVRPMFYPINKHAHLKDTELYGGISVAECLNRECVIIPSFPELQEHEIAHIVNVLKEYIRSIKWK